MDKRRRNAITLAGALILAVSFRAPALASKTVTLPAVRDTWVDEARPGAQHGRSRSLVARFERGRSSRILIGFDFGLVPAGEITNARLTVNLLSATGQGEVRMVASSIIGSWEESTSWRGSPSYQGYLARPVGSSPGDVAFNVADLLRRELGGPGRLFGIALSGTVVSETGYRRVFASRESGRRPVLIIEVSGSGAESADSDGPDPPGARAIRIAVGVILIFLVTVIAAAVYTARRRRPA